MVCLSSSRLAAQPRLTLRLSQLHSATAADTRCSFFRPNTCRWISLRPSRLSSPPTCSQETPLVTDRSSRTFPEPAGRCLREFNGAKLWRGPDEITVSITTGHEILGSYNIVKSEKPAVYVPGGPAHWKPVTLPAKVESDINFDRNDFTSKLTYPFEVLFQAVEVTKPGFGFDNVDVIISSSSLRKLFKFCSMSNELRMDFELFMVSNTLIVDTHRSTHSRYTQDKNSGGAYTKGIFGVAFQKMVSKHPEYLRDSESHHRIVHYRLGRLNCVVTCEVDACIHDVLDDLRALDAMLKEKDQSQQPSLLKSHSSQDADEDTVSATIIHRGVSDYDSQPGMDVKTKSIQALEQGFAYQPGALSKLWFSRTPYLLNAYHNQGLFDRTCMVEMYPELQKWERREHNQNRLRRVANLLADLKRTVQDANGDPCLALCQPGADRPFLRLYRAKFPRKVLPDYVIDKFWTKSGNLGLDDDLKETLDWTMTQRRHVNIPSDAIAKE